MSKKTESKLFMGTRWRAVRLVISEAHEESSCSVTFQAFPFKSFLSRLDDNLDTSVNNHETLEVSKVEHYNYSSLKYLLTWNHEINFTLHTKLDCRPCPKKAQSLRCLNLFSQKCFMTNRREASWSWRNIFVCFLCKAGMQNKKIRQNNLGWLEE